MFSCLRGLEIPYEVRSRLIYNQHSEANSNIGIRPCDGPGCETAVAAGQAPWYGYWPSWILGRRAVRRGESDLYPTSTSAVIRGLITPSLLSALIIAI
jgi:hypothetical protein